MSTKTPILNLSALSINVSGNPLSCFPKTGAILTCAPLSDDVSYTEGLNSCSALVIAPGHGYDVTINVLAFSEDHTTMDRARKLMRESGRPLSLVASYEQAKWVSTSVGIVNNPTINVNADGAEFVPYVLRGTFGEPSVGVWDAPAALELADFE